MHLSFTYNLHNKPLSGPARGEKINTCNENHNEITVGIKIHSRNILDQVNHNECSHENILYGRKIQWG